MTKELTGKAAVVTGAGRNIGRAIALALAEGGASVLVNARSNRNEAEAVAREIEAAGGKAVVHIGDVADAKAVQVMADDKLTEKKDRNINEPVQFYTAKGGHIPYELVINAVNKNEIVGYLSTPKVEATR